MISIGLFLLIWMEENQSEKEVKKELAEEKKQATGKILSPLMTDEHSTIRLRNGKTLVLSSVDAVQLGMWTCGEKRHSKCRCKKLEKYGVASVESEFYVRSKRTRIVFE